MIVKPHITEKSLALAKEGAYTFIVDPGLTKLQIKKLVGKVFGVIVMTVKTANMKKRTKRNMRGKYRTISAYKKAIVTLGEKDKIDLFEVKEK